MRKMWMVVCLLSTAVACGQTAKEALAVFQKSMGNQRFVLRNFNGDDVVRATWDGTHVELDAPRWQTTAVVELTSAKLGGGKVTLQGVRDVMVKDANDQLALYPATSEFKIEIELGNADAATVLARVKEDLFFDSLKEAMAAIPAPRNKVLPARIDKLPRAKKVSSDESQPLCDCAVKENTECEAGSVQKTGIEPPVLVRSQDPDFPETARHGPTDSEVVVGMIVDQTGHPTDLWVLQPAGMGMDEAAAKAVLKYEFRPAMCHHKPASVYLNVAVHFQRRVQGY